jgi:hypothetical protein
MTAVITEENTSPAADSFPRKNGLTVSVAVHRMSSMTDSLTEPEIEAARNAGLSYDDYKTMKGDLLS